MVTLDTCERSCEFCEGVDRGVDDCCHAIYWLTDRCPLYLTMKAYHKVAPVPDFQLVTRFTGCVYFKLDEKYKLQCEETDKMLEELHKRMELKYAHDQSVQ